MSILVSRAAPLPFLVIRNFNANFNVLELEMVLLNHFLLPLINVWHIYYIKKNPLPIKLQNYDIYGTLARKYETKALFQVHLDCIHDTIQNSYKNSKQQNQSGHVPYLKSVHTETS